MSACYRYILNTTIYSDNANEHSVEYYNISYIICRYFIVFIIMDCMLFMQILKFIICGANIHLHFSANMRSI